MKQQLQRIMVKGGILSPSELKQIVEIVEKIGFKTISLGSRQDIIFPYLEKNEEVFAQFPKLNFDLVKTTSFQNIVSSYVSATIFKTTAWINSATYLYILEQFRFLPKLKINITDPKQCLVPLFNGELNFIASEQPDYWYLYIKIPGYTKDDYYPTLVYSYDLAAVAEEIDREYLNANNIEDLFAIISSKIETNNTVIKHPLTIRDYRFPFYEGMNKRPDDTYWLGLYWRKNNYYTDFLKAICDLCTDCEIGKISITPWKSIIIKDIPKKYKLVWEKLLGQFGINIRHSSLELNWHIPVDNEEALELKRYIVNYFDQNDISTFGLTFGLNFDMKRAKNYFTSIMIEKNEIPENQKGYAAMATYNVLYAKQFNPHTQEYLYFAKDVDKMSLPILLMELSKHHFEQMGTVEVPNATASKASENVEIEHFICGECGTIYDEEFGDEAAQISAGTKFENLPNSYQCPTCEAPKASFKKANLVNVK